MVEYSKEQTLLIAKRYKNEKRTYLLVNPLQAKHMPVCPSKALEMMKILGRKLNKKYVDVNLVIGFAETATAIGAVIASCISENCYYIHTTRENYEDVNFIDFLEEHSHASEQKLCMENLAQMIDNTNIIILAEDEISTGKTIINIVRQLKEKYPQISSKKIVAASILNRVSNENEEKLKKMGIECEYLVKLPDEDYEKIAKNFNVKEAGKISIKNTLKFKKIEIENSVFYDLRIGEKIGDYIKSWESRLNIFIKEFDNVLCSSNDILVVGTEECMFPAILLGEKLEKNYKNIKVKSHSTTRSPIGVLNKDDYPIKYGIALESFYQENRKTYIYNIENYDVVIVVTDAEQNCLSAFETILNTQKNLKAGFYIKGVKDVWYI